MSKRSGTTKKYPVPTSPIDYQPNDNDSDENEETKPQFDNNKSSENKAPSVDSIIQVEKTYQELTTSIFYSMFNPTIPFPKREIIDDNEDLGDDPSIPITPAYESPVASLKLEEATKKDEAIRNRLIEHYNNLNLKNSTKLENPDSIVSPVNFVAVDLSLPAAEIARRERRREQKQRMQADMKLKEAKEKRLNDLKAKRDLIRTQKKDEILEETRQRREKIAEKEATMRPTDKRKLEKVREELKNPIKAKSEFDQASRTQEIPDDKSSHRKVKDFKEIQKKQKEKWLQTKAASPPNPDDELKKMLTSIPQADRNSWIKGV